MRSLCARGLCREQGSENEWKTARKRAVCFVVVSQKFSAQIPVNLETISGFIA